MHPGFLWGAAASAALVAGVSLVSLLQVGDWARVSTLAGHYFSTFITTTDWHQNSVIVLHWASVSRYFLGNCQTLTSTKSCEC